MNTGSHNQSGNGSTPDGPRTDPGQDKTKAAIANPVRRAPEVISHIAGIRMVVWRGEAWTWTGTRYRCATEEEARALELCRASG